MVMVSQLIFAFTATQISATDAGGHKYSIVLENVDLMGCRTKRRICALSVDSATFSSLRWILMPSVLYIETTRIQLGLGSAATGPMTQCFKTTEDMLP